ncbi:Enoyl-CoA hydratase AKT3-1 [Penicillium lividum]|nr:Enoyl-CoA hydratase AKT3-1 [Penicillium lividum]
MSAEAFMQISDLTAVRELLHDHRFSVTVETNRLPIPISEIPRVNVNIEEVGSCHWCSSQRDVQANEEEIFAHVHRLRGGRVALAMHRCHKPSIVALNGSAVGVGMAMNLPAAIRLVLPASGICQEKSKYGFITRRGLSVESRASYFLLRLIEYSCAMYVLDHDRCRALHSSRYFGDLFTEVLPDAGKVEPSCGKAQNHTGARIRTCFGVKGVSPYHWPARELFMGIMYISTRSFAYNDSLTSRQKLQRGGWLIL